MGKTFTLPIFEISQRIWLELAGIDASYKGCPFLVVEEQGRSGPILTVTKGYPFGFFGNEDTGFGVVLGPGRLHKVFIFDLKTELFGHLRSPPSSGGWSNLIIITKFSILQPLLF